MERLKRKPVSLRQSIRGAIAKFSVLGFWTQLLLAYALHKSFIFIRIPITVAITPKVVKTLRGWGWNIGNPTAKTGSIAAQAGKG